jgi:hypothetical protein
MSSGAQACALLAVCWLGACTSPAEVGADCEGASCNEQPADSGVQRARNLPAPGAPSGDIDQLDLLFAIDDSRTSMTAQQAALAAALPAFFQQLVSGEQDGAGAPEFHAPRDLHVGVVSSSLALAFAEPPPDCAPPGLDAVLQDGECIALNERFASLLPGGDVSALALEAACRVAVGDHGCRFPQLLEATLHALAAAPDGHGQDINQGFLRDDSLLVVIVLTDGDDCSIAKSGVPLGPQAIETRAKLAGGAVDALCSENPADLSSVSRFIAGLSALREREANTMLFAIAGVPPELTSAKILQQTALEEDGSRDAFYQSILDSPAMRQTVDTKGTADPSDDEITPVCNAERGLARPSRRIVELARSFAVNGLVQSICEPNLARPLDAILRSIGHRLGAVGI